MSKEIITFSNEVGLIPTVWRQQYGLQFLLLIISFERRNGFRFWNWSQLFLESPKLIEMAPENAIRKYFVRWSVLFVRIFAAIKYWTNSFSTRYFKRWHSFFQYHSKRLSISFPDERFNNAVLRPTLSNETN